MGNGLRALVFAASIIASPALAAEQQFDLICASPTGDAHYRVDLERGEVCVGSCSRVRKIASVSSGELILRDATPAYRGDLEERVTVNRLTGEWRYYAVVDGKPYSHTGRCTAAPFSGFPAAKF